MMEAGDHGGDQMDINPVELPTNDGLSTPSSAKPDQKRAGRRNRGKGVRQAKSESSTNSSKTKKVDNKSEMERDAEMRRLNAKLREQEYRMRQMEITSKAEKDMTTRVAQRVEDEVVQKLSRAAILSNMFKASQAAAEAPTSKPSFDAATSHNVPKNGKRPLLPSQQGRNRDREGAHNRGKGRGGGGGTGGLLRANPASTRPVGSNSAEKDEERNTYDRSLPVRGGKKEVNALQLNRRAVGSLEVECGALIDTIRKDKAQLQDFCVLGPANGAPEYWAKSSELDNLLCSELKPVPGRVVSLLQALEDGFASKMWMNRQRRLQLLHSVISSASRGGRSGNEGLVAQIQGVFLTELERTGDALLSVLEPLQEVLTRSVTQRVKSQLRGTIGDEAVTGEEERGDGEGGIAVTLQPYQEEVLRSGIQVLLIAMGDLNRYEMSCAGRDANDWIGAMLFYRQAARVAPFDGNVCRPLASAARSRGDLFAAGYHLARSMITPRPYAPAREAMLELFETQRITADQYETVTALSGLDMEQHSERFKCHFLAAAGIAFSRTGADRFQFHMEKCKRHLGTLLQLLTVEVIRDFGSGLGSKGDFLLFDKKNGSSKVGELSASSRRQQLNLSHGIDTMISQAVIIALSLLSTVASNSDLDAICMSVDWTNAYGGSNPSDLCVEDRLAAEKRYGAQCLHKILAVPGLLDMQRLLLGVVATLIGSAGVGVSGSTAASSSTEGSANSQSLTRIAATVRSLGLFLDWLVGNPKFFVLPVLDKTAWELMEKDLPAYVSALVPLTSARSVSISRGGSVSGEDIRIPSTQCLLEEDLDTAGLIPLQRTLDRRVHRFLEAYGEYQMMSIDQDVVSKHAVRYFDEEWVHVCAIRCSDSLRDLCATPVSLGSAEGGIYFDRNRQIMWPTACSSLTSAANRLPVIVYKAAPSSRYTGFTSSGYQASGNQKFHILSEEEFMRGALPSAVEEHAVDSVNEDGASLEGSGEGDGEISDLSDDDGVAVEEREASVPSEEGSTGADSSPSAGGIQMEEREEGRQTSARHLLAARCAALLKGKSANVDEVRPAEVDDTVECGKAPPAAAAKGMLRVANMESVLVSPAAASSNAKKKDGGNGGRRHPNCGIGKKNTSGLPQHLAVKSSNGELPLIVIDAPNVAMRHGINSKFSCRGIKLAIDFFHAAGHRVVSFLPDHYLNFERVGELRRLAALKISDVRAAQLPDDVSTLQQLFQQGFIIGTPSQDYDDSYCINYARQRGGYIISNDMYRDHIKRIEQAGPREQARQWIKTHVISYTFVGDEFLPNPDASIT